MKHLQRTTLVIIGIVVAFATLSCSKDSAIYNSLLTVEQIMHDKPDSALAILKSINSENISSEKENALYALLLTQVQDKNHVRKKNDSLISIAVDYYQSTNEHYHKMLAYYHKAKINLNNNKYSTSFINLRKAEKEAIAIGDNHYLGLIYKNFAIIYLRLNNLNEHLRYAILSYDSFAKADNPDDTDWARLYLARAYSYLNDYKTSLLFSKKVVDNAAARKNKNLLVAGLRHSAMASFKSNKFRESISYYNRVREIRENSLRDIDYYALGMSYYRLGKRDSATICMNTLKILNPSDKRLQHRLSNKYSEKYLQSLDSLTYASGKKNRLASATPAINASEEIDNYFKLEQEYQNKLISEQKIKLTLVFITLILVLAFTIATIIILKKNHKKDIENRMLLISDLKNSLNSTGENANELQKVIANLYKSKFEDLDRLCSNYYEYKGNANERDRVYKEITNIISKTGTKGNTIKEIEKFINTYQNNLLKNFKKDFPKISEDEYLMFIYLIAGFSPRAISVFIDKELDVVYNKKSRLKKKIEKSASPDRDSYLSKLR